MQKLLNGILRYAVTDTTSIHTLKTHPYIVAEIAFQSVSMAAFTAFCMAAVLTA
mgnify:CR=1 FL=1